MDCVLISNSSPHRCGYCKNEKSSISDTIFVPSMEPIVYQKLIDRGWRRSGKTCYKPRMQQTCCPQYTIKCDAVNFNLSKSQKKLLKKWITFLKDGKRNSDSADEKNAMNSMTVTIKNSEDVHNRSTVVKKGLGPDASKPPCRKAKVLRLERKQNKANESTIAVSPSVEQSNVLDAEIKKQPLPIKKSHEDIKTFNDFFLEIFSIESPQHKLKIEIVPAAENTSEIFQLYKKYQHIVHKDEIDDINEENFVEFLVSSPLKNEKTSNVNINYGSFHQKYWLDNKLIAVGVIDILPFCLSSVYFFYDPEFNFLSLGTFGSLVEILQIQTWQRKLPDLKWYYMGYYIHECSKMRYKINMKPSYLLCPETYSWVETEKCLEKLNVKRYNKLSDDDVKQEIDKFVCFGENVRVACGRYHQTLKLYLSNRPSKREILERFGNLFGHYCTHRLQLISFY